MGLVNQMDLGEKLINFPTVCYFVARGSLLPTWRQQTIQMLAGLPNKLGKPTPPNGARS
jgi:hypothetical protein